MARLRRWFAVGAVLITVTVAGMYFHAQWRSRQSVHVVPAKVGLDIQQTAEGFSISKSVEGRTLFTVSASRAVQYKGGGRAELHHVKIVIYGKDAGRFDRITGDDFAYEPATGEVSAKGKVLIDLQANPEALRHSDQAAPEARKNAIHVESDGLVFNKNTGDASATGQVVFQTPQAAGSAVGMHYVSKTGILNLLSAVALEVSRPQPLRLNAERGSISKEPRNVVLDGVRLVREQERMRSDRVTFSLRDDNTVDRVLAEGDVEGQFGGVPTGATSGPERPRSEAHSRSDRAELFLAGTGNQLHTAVLSGNVHFTSGNTTGSANTGRPGQIAEAAAGRVTLNFSGGQVLRTVHAEDGVRLTQNIGQDRNAQDVEMAAPAMDFIVKDGRQLERAETSGPPRMVITQAGENQTAVVTAARFTAKFTGNNRLATLHGEPDVRIVTNPIATPKSTGGAAAERTSTSQTLDVVFRPEGGVASITQSGAVAFVDSMQKAWAQRADYTTADQQIALTGSPRVEDNGMTTTAQTIRINRVTGDAIAEGGVKSTYSELKAQSGGGLLASSDPIHVTSRTMTAHRSPAIALYRGGARLWQNANVVEAPTLQFDRDQRSVVAQADPALASKPGQAVSTVLVQMDASGKAVPVNLASGSLRYADAERRIFLEGGVTVKGSGATMTAERMTVFLLPPEPSHTGASVAGGTTGRLERIVADGKVVITQPARRATGDRLVYTAADDKFVLIGGPPSIFDAEHGQITGDSLTFYRHDDRVLVEGKEKFPSVTRTQVAR